MTPQLVLVKKNNLLEKKIKKNVTTKLEPTPVCRRTFLGGGSQSATDDTANCQRAASGHNWTYLGHLNQTSTVWQRANGPPCRPGTRPRAAQMFLVPLCFFSFSTLIGVFLLQAAGGPEGVRLTQAELADNQTLAAPLQ